MEPESTEDAGVAPHTRKESSLFGKLSLCLAIPALAVILIALYDLLGLTAKGEFQGVGGVILLAFVGLPLFGLGWLLSLVGCFFDTQKKLTKIMLGIWSACLLVLGVFSIA